MKKTFFCVFTLISLSSSNIAMAVSNQNNNLVNNETTAMAQKSLHVKANTEIQVRRVQKMFTKGSKEINLSKSIKVFEKFINNNNK